MASKRARREVKTEGAEEPSKRARREVKTEVKVDADEPAVVSMLRCAKVPWESPPLQPAAGSKGSLRIGTSGYIYKHWKGTVYPKEVPQKEWFRLYTYMFDTVEINNTFYRLPAEDVFESWYKQAPPGFSYALKYSRYGSHMKRLKDPEGHVNLFMERSRPLKEFCGPILVQIPPKFDLNIDRLKAFLDLTPPSFRWALEVRDTRWLCDQVYELLRSRNVALCIHDHEDIAETHPKVLTADWLYLRFHGKNYQHCYTTQQLEVQAEWIRSQLASGIDVFAYFNNDAHGYAVSNALSLRDMILGTQSSVKAES